MMTSHSVLGLVIRLILPSCICRSSFDGMGMAIDPEFLFSSAGVALYLYAHLSPILRPPEALNFVHSGTRQELQSFPF